MVSGVEPWQVGKMSGDGMKELIPQDQVFWYLNKSPIQQYSSVTGVLKTDVVVVGGGMAGLSAAQAFRERGLSVALVEKYFCGAGASGKSSGFITPDSEIELSVFIKRFGENAAHKLWEFALAGSAQIRENIQKFALSCDYLSQDTLVVANRARAFKNLQHQAGLRAKLGYQTTLYTKEQLSALVNTTHYAGGAVYPDSFSINSFDYCQGMKKVLQNMGVEIFEETPVTKITKDGIETVNGPIEANYIIVCTDRFIPDFGKLVAEIYHAQTFLMLSAPLTLDQLLSLFPQKKDYMVWDTNLIYSYFRLTADNRLLVGGADLLATYASSEWHNSSIYKKHTNYIKKRFPDLDILFEYYWPGMIGISKDLMPLAGPDLDSNNIYYVGACSGLPWAAALGRYSAEKLLDKRSDFDHFFSPQRKFFIGSKLQKLLGKPISFALSNIVSIY